MGELVPIEHARRRRQARRDLLARVGDALRRCACGVWSPRLSALLDLVDNPEPGEPEDRPR